MRTYGVKSVIWSEAVVRDREQSQFWEEEKPVFLHTCATCSELPYDTSTMVSKNTEVLKWILQQAMHAEMIYEIILEKKLMIALQIMF